MVHRCPVCHKKIKSIPGKPAEKTKYFPFCSRRCKLIDLGAWLDEDYKISAPVEQNDNEQDYPSELPPE